MEDADSSSFIIILHHHRRCRHHCDHHHHHHHLHVSKNPCILPVLGMTGRDTLTNEGLSESGFRQPFCSRNKLM